ncbi:fimbrial protein [Moraxella sp. VT-16-12]|uniref:fimbrial protein n=1 Tax=Moraxella sp. VT-16-12 TaxID=2014877 RepID=UPI000B7CA03A|nr:fimbrial protein [Moraxella sp. VT-16-12]TWV80537.1 type 1 fimbrial protein [Moraxella sp. VT-16-12]
MKKSLLVLAVAMLSTSAFADDTLIETEDPTLGITASTATSGMVKFTDGRIIQSTCKIATDSVNKVVQLKSVQSNEFKTVGDVAGSVEFVLKVADCPNTYVDGETGEKKTKLGIKFTSSSNITADGRLKNIATGVAAEGVELQLLNSGNGVINLNDNTNNDPVQPIGGKNHILNYVARYVSTGNVYAGKFETNVPFTVQYK